MTRARQFWVIFWGPYCLCFSRCCSCAVVLLVFSCFLCFLFSGCWFVFYQKHAHLTRYCAFVFLLSFHPYFLLCGRKNKGEKYCFTVGIRGKWDEETWGDENKTRDKSVLRWEFYFSSWWSRAWRRFCHFDNVEIKVRCIGFSAVCWPPVLTLWPRKPRGWTQIDYSTFGV